MRYLTVLAFLFLAGCASMPMAGITNSYTDYQYKSADGSEKIHRVYRNGQQEWLTPSALRSAE